MKHGLVQQAGCSISEWVSTNGSSFSSVQYYKKMVEENLSFSTGTQVKSVYRYCSRSTFFIIKIYMENFHGFVWCFLNVLNVCVRDIYFLLLYTVPVMFNPSLQRSGLVGLDVFLER